MDLQGIRKQYPAYEDMSDEQLAKALHSKYYSDMDFKEFSGKIGYQEPEPELEAEPETDANSYSGDQFRMGITDMFRDFLPDFALSAMGMQPSLKDSKQNPDGTFDTKQFQTDSAQMTEQFARDNLGYQGVAPESTVDELMGAGARGMADPLVLAGAKAPTKSVAGVLGSLGSVGAELLHSYVAGAAGSTAAKVTRDNVTELTGSDLTGELTAAVVAGLTGAGVSAGRSAVSGGLDAVHQSYTKRKELVGTVDKASEYLATTEIGHILNKATQAQPDIDQVAKAAHDLEQAIPGLVLPASAALAGNPVIRKNMYELLKRDPNFFAKVKARMEDANNAIDARREQLFGKSDQSVEAEIRASLPKDYGVKLKAAQKRIDNIDDQLGRLADRVDSKVDVEGVGTAAKNLVKAKEDAIRAALSPQYTKLIEDADSRGITMGPESVAAVHQTLQNMRYDNTFATFPNIVEKVKRYWSPKEVENPVIYGPKGEALSGGKGLAYEAVGVKEVDSLKREINKAQRNTSDRDKWRALQTLKESLNKSIQNMDAGFAEQYKALDRSYYEQLGIPFDQAGLSQIDSSRFATSAGTYLSKPEHVRDFLAFTGDQGIPIVRDAIMLRLRDGQNKIVKKDGSIDVANLNKFLKKEAKLISEVPGLRNELSDIGRTVSELTETKARLDDAYTKAARENADGFYQAINDKSLSQVVDEVLRSPGSSGKYLKDLEKLTPDTARMVKQAVRSEIVRKAVASNGSMQDFMKSNANTISSWFGKTYLEDMNYIATASDILKRLDVDNIRFSVDFRRGDALEESTGTSFASLSSIARDRITSGIHKLSILGSRWQIKTADAKRDAALERLLLEPKALRELRETVEHAKSKDLSAPDFVKAVGSKAAYIISKGAYFGEQGAEAWMEENPPIRP